MGTLMEAKKENMSLGKDKFIDKLVKNYKKSIKDMSVMDLIEDHLGFYPQYRSMKLLNKIRKLNKKEAQKACVLFYKKGLLKKNLEQLVDENT